MPGDVAFVKLSFADVASQHGYRIVMTGDADPIVGDYSQDNPAQLSSGSECFAIHLTFFFDRGISDSRKKAIEPGVILFCGIKIQDPG